MDKIDTNCYQFAKNDMFKVLAKNLPNNKLHTQNIVECKDDVLYAWNSVDFCVMSLNWRAANTNTDKIGVNYQVSNNF